MEIELGVGLGHIRFGMTESQVKSVYGEPNEIVNLKDDNQTDFQYYKEQTTFRFYHDHEGRLGWIETQNPKVLLFGKEIIGQNKSFIIGLLTQEGHEKYEYEKYETFDSLFYEDVWLELELNYELITCVKFGVFIDENDNYIWKNQ